MKKVFAQTTSDICLKCTLGIKMWTKLVSPHDFLLYLKLDKTSVFHALNIAEMQFEI